MFKLKKSHETLMHTCSNIEFDIEMPAMCYSRDIYVSSYSNRSVRIADCILVPEGIFSSKIVFLACSTAMLINKKYDIMQ